jgi:hypothetical protein
MAAGMLAVLPLGAGPAKSWDLSGTISNDDVPLLSALVTRWLPPNAPILAVS